MAKPAASNDGTALRETLSFSEYEKCMEPLYLSIHRLLSFS